jgi:urease accessory protein
MKVRAGLPLAASLWTALLPLTAHAHSIDEAQSFGGGFLHPLRGPDHLLAMLSVGIISVRMGEWAVFAVPGAFVASMLVGGTIGALGVHLPLVEVGIALSVLLLGVAIAVATRFPVWLAMAIVALFGCYHGNAHGVEMPRSSEPVFYSFGFLVATVIIHLLGVGFGYIPAIQERTRTGIVGAAISAAGVAFLIRLVV